MVDQRRTLSRVATKVFSDRTLTKKATLNSLASSLDYAARAVVGLVVNPILVRYLGDVGFGNWQVLQRLVGHANPAGGRPAEALKWTVANRQSFTDYENKRVAVGSAVAVWLLFLPVLAVLGGVLGWFAPVWLHVPADSFTALRLAAAILVADLILTGLTSVPQAVLQGENLGYKRVGMTAALVFVGGGLSIAAAVLGTGIVGLAVATIATTLLTGALFMWIVGHYITWFGIARPSFSAVGRFVRLSWWFLLWNLVMKMTMGSDIVVLGIAGSSRAVASYSLTRYVPVTITALVTVVIFGIMPGLGGMIGAGDLSRAVRVRTETMSVTWLLATVAGAGVLIWEESFLRLWVGARFYPGTVPTLMIMLMILQFTMIRVDSNIIDLTLNLRRKVLLGLLSTGLSVAFAWVLVSKFHMGIGGLALGFIAGRTIQSVAYPWMVGRILGIRPQAQLRGMARPGLVTGVLFALASLLGTVVGADSWMGLVLASGLSAVGLAILAFFGGLSGRQRIRVWSRVKRVVTLE